MKMTENKTENTQEVAPVVVKNKNVKEFPSEITGVKYMFQKVAPPDWLDILDDADAGDPKTKRRRLYAAVLDNVVVSPRKTLNDFDDYAELELVVSNAIRFQQGK